MRNGAWHPEEHLPATPSPQIAPRVDGPTPGDVPAPLHEGLLALVKQCPWWALLYTGFVLGVALNSRSCGS